MKSKIGIGSNRYVTIIVTIMALVLGIGVMFFANYKFTRSELGGTDFLYRWLPTRLILFEGYQNPYSPEVEYQVELMHHGHAHQGIETPGIFAYPYYIIPLYIPISLVKDYNLARAIWMTMLELVQISIVILSLRLINFKPRKITLVLLMIISIFSSYFTQPIIDGNPSPVAALLAFLSLIAITKNKDWLAGILLACCTIKPQLVILFFALVWIWAFSHKRWKIILGSAFTLTVLMGVSFSIQPSWFAEFLKDVLLYPDVASPHSPISIMRDWFPFDARWITIPLSAVVAVLLVKEWICVYKKEFGSLFWVTALTFSLMPISGISSAHSNFIAILPGFILLVAALDHRWQKKSFIIDVFLALVPIVCWTFFFIGRNGYIGDVRIYYIDFFPVPILMAIGLYWLRKYTRRVNSAVVDAASARSLFPVI